MEINDYNRMLNKLFINSNPIQIYIHDDSDWSLTVFNFKIHLHNHNQIHHQNRHQNLENLYILDVVYKAEISSFTISFSMSLSVCTHASTVCDTFLLASFASPKVIYTRSLNRNRIVESNKTEFKNLKN